MLLVEIKSENINTKKGVGKKTGNPYEIREQTGYVSLFDDAGQPKPYPTEINIALADGAKPFPPGVYMIAPQSVRQGNFGQLEFGRLVLALAPKGK